MEKKFLLAIILSVGVLYLWNMFTYTPSVTTANTSQLSTQKEGKDSPLLESILVETPQVIPTQQVQEKLTYLENDLLLISLSNVGGSIESVTIKEFNRELPITNIAGVKGLEDVVFEEFRVNDTKIEFVSNTESGRIRKSYDLDGYLVKMSVDVDNLDKMSKLNNLSVVGYQIDAARMDISSKDMAIQRDKTLNEYAVKYGKKEHRKSKAYKFKEKERKDESGAIQWVAFRDRYFCAIVKPTTETSGFSIDPEDTTHLSVIINTENTSKLDAVAYFGPEDNVILKKYDLGFEAVKKYYRFGLFDFMGKIINQIIHLIYKVVPNWGVCILIMSVLIYFSMYPLTKKSMLSMKKMQSVAPKINAIKEKHKNDKQKLNAEMMDIYKREKINPIGGCLPVLFQMPIFLGLYQVLWRSVSFKGAKFLWIQDLTEPDRLMIFPFTMPVLGNELNILPLFMVVIMFFQQKFSSKNMITTDPMQKQQQQMMMYMMPLFLGFIFYKFSSGLTLYFTMFYLFSTITQWRMSRDVKVG